MTDTTKNLIKKLVYSDAEVEEIKKVNKQAIRHFFNTNYDLIIERAKTFYLKKYLDLVSQFYVDLSQFNFDSKESLIKSINKCFNYVDCGGINGKESELKNIACNLSLDKNINNEQLESHLIFFSYEYDYIAKLNEAETIKQEEEKDKQILEFLKKTFTTKKQFKKMYFKIFTDLKIY